MMTFTKDELLKRLRELAALKNGDPPPEWLDLPNDWGPALASFLGVVADYIADEEQRFQQRLDNEYWKIKDTQVCTVSL